MKIGFITQNYAANTNNTREKNFNAANSKLGFGHNVKVDDKAIEKTFGSSKKMLNTVNDYVANVVIPMFNKIAPTWTDKWQPELELHLKVGAYNFRGNEGLAKDKLLRLNVLAVEPANMHELLGKPVNHTPIVTDPISGKVIKEGDCTLFMESEYNRQSR